MSYGEKLREVRKRIGLTLEDVSNKTGFTKSFISQIENSKNSPSIASLKKICQALTISISELFDDERSVVHIFKPEDFKIYKHDKLSISFIASKFMARRLEPFILELDANGETTPETYQHLGEEFGYVISGEIVVVVGCVEHVLKAGESIYFTSSQPHKVKNTTSESAKALWVGSQSVF